MEKGFYYRKSTGMQQKWILLYECIGNIKRFDYRIGVDYCKGILLEE